MQPPNSILRKRRVVLVLYDGPYIISTGKILFYILQKLTSVSLRNLAHHTFTPNEQTDLEYYRKLLLGNLNQSLIICKYLGLKNPKIVSYFLGESYGITTYRLIHGLFGKLRNKKFCIFSVMSY